MSDNNNIPQFEAEQINKSAMEARYTAYMKCGCKLKMDERAKTESTKKAGIEAV